MRGMEESECAIWGTPASLNSKDYGMIKHYDSLRAGGRYVVKGIELETLGGLPEKEKAILSFYIAKSNFQGEEFEVTQKFLDQLKRRRMPGPAERGAALLKNLAVKYPEVGTRIHYINTLDQDILDWYAWSGSVVREEIAYLFSHLADVGYFEIMRNADGVPRGYRISPTGFEFIENQQVNLLSDQAFVAMWFDPSMNAAYEHGIEKAIVEAGYNPMIIRKKEHNNKIDDEIIAEIRRSKFVVADFTSERDSPRGGVYFEAGFAQGLGIDVIWTCKEELIDQVHFDTRQFNHIVWIDTDDLFRKLKARIGATIGWGPNNHSAAT